jgi:hypothetical protein
MLEEGVARLEVEHSGNASFFVTIFGDASDDVKSLIKIGAYSGERAHPVHADAITGLRPGEHSLEIATNGQWSIEVIQEFPVSGDAVPVAVNGTGDSVVRWINLEEGNHNLPANHDGEGLLKIEAFNANGQHNELVNLHIGVYSGQNRIKVGKNAFTGLRPGLHAIVITADGNWDINLTK